MATVNSFASEASRTVGASSRDSTRSVSSRQIRPSRSSPRLTTITSLTAALKRAGPPRLEGTGEVTVEPAATHGVHLHVSRYE